MPIENDCKLSELAFIFWNTFQETGVSMPFMKEILEIKLGLQNCYLP